MLSCGDREAGECVMKVKRLSRRWARRCSLLMVAGCGLVLLGAVLRAKPVLIVGCVLLVAEVILQVTFLRCRYCGRDVAPPRWNPGRHYYCNHCGKPFLFDDEPEEIEEDQTREE